jgi:hypothetical protein
MDDSTTSVGPLPNFDLILRRNGRRFTVSLGSGGYANAPSAMVAG